MASSILLVSGGGIIILGLIAVVVAVLWVFIIVLRIGFNPRAYEKERAQTNRGVHPRDAQMSVEPSDVNVGDSLALIDRDMLADDNRFVVTAKLDDAYGNYHLFLCTCVRRGVPEQCVISAFRGVAEDIDPPWTWGLSLRTSELSLSKVSRYQDDAEPIRGVVKHSA